MSLDQLYWMIENIPLRRSLLALITAIVLILSFTPAHAGIFKTCSFKALPAIPDININVVASGSGETVTSPDHVEMNCETLGLSVDTKACIGLETGQPRVPLGDVYNNPFFYLTQAGSSGNDDPRLAVQVLLNAGPLGPRIGNLWTGLRIGVPDGSPVRFALGYVRQKINFSGLGIKLASRSSQDRVQPGTYTGSFNLTAKYGGVLTGTTCSGGDIIKSETFTVTVKVLPTCQFENMQNIDFGTKGIGDASASATGNIGVRCTYKTDYKIAIDKGVNATSDGVRRMKNGNSFVPYELFQRDCKTAWTQDLKLRGTGTTVNMINNHQICATMSIPKTGSLAPKTYTDTVTTTIEF